jgi:2-hydroxy-6-oxonona-2,4-dienedioate hydrolase
MINFRRVGSGSSLILQHGFLGGSGYWEPQFAAFGRHFDVIAPDLPGFAGSGDIEAPDTLAGFAAALTGLLDKLRIERTMLLGHSMGSMIALQIALDHPERIDRLVLYGSASTGDLPGRFEPFEESIARIE